VVAEIAHRVASCAWGELVEMGPTEQILSRPSHSYTKMLILSVPSIHPVHRGVRLDGVTVLRTEKLGKTYSGKAFFQKARTVKAASMSISTSAAARRWASWANRAPASRRWRAVSPA